MGIKHYTRDQLATTFGNNLRAARKARQLTQAQVAESISVSNEFYARLERGKSLPSADTLVALVESLDVTADALFGEAIAPIQIPSCMDDLPARQAQLARRILAMDAEAQRVVNLLLCYCLERFDESDEE